MALKEEKIKDIYPVVDDIERLPPNMHVPESFLGISYETILWNIRNSWDGCASIPQVSRCEETKGGTLEYFVFVFKGEKWGKPEVTKFKKGMFGINKTMTRVTVNRMRCYDMYKVTFREYKCYCSWLFQYVYTVVEAKERIGEFCKTVSKYSDEYEGDIEIDLEEVLKTIKTVASKGKK